MVSFKGQPLLGTSQLLLSKDNSGWSHMQFFQEKLKIHLSTEKPVVF